MAPATKLSLPEQIAAQAQFIVDNLLQTDYQHVEKVDVDRGIYDCDCNGFVSIVLERAAPRPLRDDSEGDHATARACF